MFDPSLKSPLVIVVLIGWLPAVLALFALLPGRRATIVAFLFAWSFLPVYEFELPMLPDYDKMTATSIGVFCAALILDTQRIFRFRANWLDLFVLLLSFCPFLSAKFNGLGTYEGLSAAFAMSVAWLLPYLVGRLYFSTLDGMRELAVGVFIAGLVYIPLCLYEIRMSPQLHRLVYGYHTTRFADIYRFGGWRPVVFMGNGLMLGMWMAVSALCGCWLWLSGTIKRMLGVPVWVYAAALVTTAILCRSIGAVALLLAGLGILAVVYTLRTSVPILALAGFVALFILVRASGLYPATGLINVADSLFGPRRAASLETRIINDNMLAAKARQRLLFGWGRFGRSRVYDDKGRDVSLTDSMWVIRFGQNGALGLTALVATLLLPCVMLRFRLPPGLWTHPVASGAVLFALILCLWMVDNLLNAMTNPVYTVMAGGLAGLRPVSAARASRAQAARSRRRRARPVTESHEEAPAAAGEPGFDHRERIAARRRAIKQRAAADGTDLSKASSWEK